MLGKQASKRKIFFRDSNLYSQKIARMKGVWLSYNFSICDHQAAVHGFDKIQGLKLGRP